nr:MAG: DNA binding protein [Microviridae sp.]
MKRYKMNKKRSKRVFSHHAVKSNRKNQHATPMRGGFRI